MNRFTDVGIEVHRVNEVHIGIFLSQVLDCSAHADEAFAEVFAAVAGDEDKTAGSFASLRMTGNAIHVVAAAVEFCAKGTF